MDNIPNGQIADTSIRLCFSYGTEKSRQCRRGKLSVNNIVSATPQSCNLSCITYHFRGFSRENGGNTIWFRVANACFYIPNIFSVIPCGAAKPRRIKQSLCRVMISRIVSRRLPLQNIDVPVVSGDHCTHRWFNEAQTLWYSSIIS